MKSCIISIQIIRYFLFADILFAIIVNQQIATVTIIPIHFIYFKTRAVVAQYHLIQDTSLTKMRIYKTNV